MIVLRVGDSGTPRVTYLVARQKEPDNARHSVLLTKSMLTASRFTAVRPKSVTYSYLRDPDGIKAVRLEGEWAQSASIEATRISASREAKRERRKR